MAWHEVAQEKELQSGTKKRCVVGDEPIALFNVDGQYYATQDKCTHKEASLSSGIMHGCEIECPWHGARFDVKTGELKVLPAAVPLKTYKTKVENGKVFVEIG